jgi:SpoVK/Ycf46/Vps4 family AAA+-type ATPase
MTSPKQNQNINGFDDLLAHPSGLLLYGPPGCGKTLLAKSLAFTAGARFLCVKHSDLQRKYYGETNLRVRGLFSLARKIQPCIIFVDEVDGLFRERYSGGSGGEEHDASRDLKTEFMQLWDGISSKKSDKILVMGATNRPFDVDAAFLRRMPRSYFVGLPDVSARIYILQNLLQGVPLSPDFDIGRQIIVGIVVSSLHLPFISLNCHLFSNYSPEMIACQTQGYSPSDLKELLRVAVLAPLREARVNSLSAKLSMGLPVSTLQIRPLQPSDVTKARRIVTPTQYSAAYRSAIADYVSRYQGSLNAAGEDSSNKECIDSEEEEISEPFSEGEGMSSFDDD